MRHRLRISDQESHEVWLVQRGEDLVLLHEHGEHIVRPTPGATVVTDGDEVHIHLDGRAYRIRYEHPLDRFAAEAGGAADDVARAPMPGVVLAVEAAPGQAVSAGDTLLVIESMKLETTVRAARDGVVETVHVAPGQTFERDAPLVTLASRET